MGIELARIVDWAFVHCRCATENADSATKTAAAMLVFNNQADELFRFRLLLVSASQHFAQRIVRPSLAKWPHTIEFRPGLNRSGIRPTPHQRQRPALGVS